MGTWFCDVREPTPETCDGFDQDCDGVIDDGLTRACSNSCGSGIETCLSGVYTGCTAPTPTTEVCDNVDNDCNGMVDDLPPRPCTVSGGCGAVTGTETCAGGVWTCSAMGITEACNGRDDDCNGIIDDGAACPCPVRHYGGHAYMFCATPNSWTGGLAACRASSYELVTINDAGENTFVTDAALTDRNDDWWIGISDQAMEGTWVWAYGTSSYTHWDPGEPGNYMAGSFDCGNIENGSDGTEARTWWADRPCSNTRPYVCETR
ncbi:MAG: C-type lectin domain-containing protein [Sandaracinaceae bacterium]|nr:C-type lectin domain-containing protein [Sandaracinaceae bacterium]